MATSTLEELFENTPLLKREELNSYQEWMRSQPHFPHFELIDLVPMISSCSYDMSKSKINMEKYLTMRTHASEIFRFRDPREPPTCNQLKLFHMTSVGKDGTGKNIVCFRWQDVGASEFVPESVAYLALSLMEILVKKEPTSPGFIFVVDATNFTSGHLMKLSISFVKKILCFIQEAIPALIIAVHTIRLTPITGKLVSMLKPFLSQSTKNKLFFHTKDLTEFYRSVPENLLPMDYGGRLRPVEEFFQEDKQEIMDNIDYLRTLDVRVVNEALRPGGPKKPRDVFGILGVGLFG